MHSVETGLINSRLIAILAWSGIFCLITIPLVIAVNSPLLAGRDQPYIVGGLAGVIALGILLLQPLLAAGSLPGLSLARGRRWHRRVGTVLLLAVALHIAGLYLTSPPDMIDALLLAAPTFYSLYGVIAMWGLILISLLVATRSRLRLQVRIWRIIHNALAVIVVIASVAHALMIQGAMGQVSKVVLCISVLIVSSLVTFKLRRRAGKPVN